MGALNLALELIEYDDLKIIFKDAGTRWIINFMIFTKGRAHYRYLLLWCKCIRRLNQIQQSSIPLLSEYKHGILTNGLVLNYIPASGCQYKLAMSRN